MRPRDRSFYCASVRRDSRVERFEPRLSDEWIADQVIATIKAIHVENETRTPKTRRRA